MFQKYPYFYKDKEKESSHHSLQSPKRSSENRLFEETSYNAIRTAQRRKRTLIITIVVILIIIIGIIINHQIQSNRLQHLSDAYAKIDLLYNQESINFNAEYTKATPEQQKQMKPNYDESMNLFAQFAQENSSTPYGWQAAVRSSTYFLAKNNIKVTKDILLSISPFVQKEPVLQFKINSSLASIYASEKEYQKALLTIDLIMNNPKNPSINQTRLLKAEILNLAGKNEESKKLLTDIINAPNINPSSSLSFQESQTQQQAKILLNYFSK